MKISSRLMKSIRSRAVATMLASGPWSLTSAPAAQFGDDAAFLAQHTPLVKLSDRRGEAQVLLAPDWQGRVMTSTSSGDSGLSYGWINRALIASGKLQPHIQVYGGEDRFWLGPEGGQYSIFFGRGAKFALSDWYTPAAIDTLPYQVVKQSLSSVVFGARFGLTNYSGARFSVEVEREVKLLGTSVALKRLGVGAQTGLRMVAFESINRIRNVGDEPWKKETGLLSIWILGMFNPSPTTTIVVPIRPGPESKWGPKVTSDYFGAVPSDRLVVKDDVIFFSGDGQFRSKIGIGPRRSRSVLGSYDAANRVLTVVQFTQPEGVTDYVNSLWKIQDDPYGGDAANSYNDGPPSPGAKPLGPFYELESSSPAAALAPRRSLTHVHRTFHLSGDASALDAVARRVLGVSLVAMEAGLKR